MEIQLQELINQIKQDGVAAAEAEAKNIIDAAKAEAEKIVKDAQKKADEILDNGKRENQRVVRSGEDAIRQAGRNLLLSFRESVGRELGVILNKQVSELYSSDAFANLIVKTVEEWAKKPEVDSITLLLTADDLKHLEDALLAEMKARLLTGVTLKASDSFDGGFRIAVNNGNAYYDYSADAVVEMLATYLSPQITRLLKEAK